jgi:hypothetical protein
MQTTGLTKQRRWQLKMLAAGRCQQCGAMRVAGSAVHCGICRDKDRTAGRNRHRRRVGIPLNVPVHAARGLRKCG